MITIPTCELVGIIADVVTFASTDKEYPAINAVRIYWDGDNLRTEATDRYIIGRAFWHPGDDPEIDVQEELGTDWGGADDPWSVVVPLADAKDIVSVFKLPPKEGWAALTVELIDDHRLKIVRHRDTGHSALTQVIAGSEAAFPNVYALIKDALFDVEIGQVAFNAKAIAGFAKVRQRGPLQLSFSGENKMARVTIGARFDGAIMPIRTSAEESPEARKLASV